MNIWKYFEIFYSFLKQLVEFVEISAVKKANYFLPKVALKRKAVKRAIKE